jgi:hypothetical protein
MALEMNDLMMLRGLDKEGLSPYEQVKLDYMSNRNHTSGLGIAGLTVGVGAAVLALAAGAWAGSRAQNAKDVAVAKNDGLRDLVQTLAGTLATERAERIHGDYSITQTVNDTVSGSQQGTLTAQQAAELSAVNSVMQQTYTDFVTGRASLNPTPVSLYSAPQPCNCPGCGCNG